MSVLARTIVIGLTLALVTSGCAATSSTGSAPPPTVEEVITQGQEAQITPQGVRDLTGLFAALQASGAVVDATNNVAVEQPFFSVPGRVISVNGFEVQVFEYGDESAAAAEAALIAPDGSSVGTSMITWVDTPHFYQSDNLIVLYVGGDSAVQQALTAELGSPVAEGPLQPPPTDTPEPSPYWNVYTDSYTGLSFAAPCFWNIQLSDTDPLTTDGGYMHAQNIPENYAMDYPLAFPRGEGVFDIGGIKIELLYRNLTYSGYPAGTSLQDYLTAEYQHDSMPTLLGTEEIEINGQAGLLVTSESNYGVIQYYIFSFSDELVLSLYIHPQENYADIEGFINSISFSADNPVVIPSHTPAAPLPGLAAPCIPDYAEASAPPEPLNFNEGQTTECGVHSFTSLEFLTDTVTSSLQNRDIGTLVYSGYVNEPFLVGYWQSEGVSLDPLEVFSTMANQLFPPDPSTLTFTTNRDEFPPLFGTPPESMFGPDYTVAEIHYSEGWGPEGQGAALLYYMQDSCGGYFWHGMIYAGNSHFDQ